MFSPMEEHAPGCLLAAAHVCVRERPPPVLASRRCACSCGDARECASPRTWVAGELHIIMLASTPAPLAGAANEQRRCCCCASLGTALLAGVAAAAVPPLARILRRGNVRLRRDSAAAACGAAHQHTACAQRSNAQTICYRRATREASRASYLLHDSTISATAAAHHACSRQAENTPRAPRPPPAAPPGRHFRTSLCGGVFFLCFSSRTPP
jgi:hypothetical protein